MALQSEKVVILLATYNGERFLDEQLGSLARQQHANWELLVSDDGSHDRTLERVSAFKASVTQPVTVFEGPGRGFCRNFMSLIRRDEDANYVAFCDQDDVWLPGKLARALKVVADLDPRVPAVYFTRTQLIDESGAVIGASPLFRRAPTFRNALVQNIGGGNTMVLNRAAHLLLRQTPHDVEVVSHDWWTYQLVTGAGGIAVYDSEPSVQYRQHVKNIVGSNRGLSARLHRLREMMAGRVVSWNDINAAALVRLSHLLAPKQKLTLMRFLDARKVPSIFKPLYLAKAGVYRQNAIETLGLYAGALANRI